MQDVMNRKRADYWRARAREYEDAKHKPTDHTARKSGQDIVQHNERMQAKADELHRTADDCAFDNPFDLLVDVLLEQFNDE